MIVLDENVAVAQRAQLRRWRVSVRQIGYDVGRSGTQDPEILPLLRMLRRPTFISCDRDFSDRAFCSNHYCSVFLDVRPREAAVYTRRLLRHPAFKSWTQRRGCVMRVTPSGILAWRIHERRPTRDRWKD